MFPTTVLFLSPDFAPTFYLFQTDTIDIDGIIASVGGSIRHRTTYSMTCPPPITAINLAVLGFLSPIASVVPSKALQDIIDDVQRHAATPIAVNNSNTFRVGFLLVASFIAAVHGSQLAATFYSVHSFISALVLTAPYSSITEPELVFYAVRALSQAFSHEHLSLSCVISHLERDIQRAACWLRICMRVALSSSTNARNRSFPLSQLPPATASSRCVRRRPASSPSPDPAHHVCRFCGPLHHHRGRWSPHPPLRRPRPVRHAAVS